MYLDDPYIPAFIHVPVEFEDREVLEEFLSERRGRKVEIHTPQRGQKKAMLELVESNAKHSFEQRFRVLKPSSKAIQAALQDALGLENAPNRIECFDISHIQGTDKVASMVVWENGRMKKSDYRKFIIRTVEGNDDFASMREVITRRYGRLKEEKHGAAGAGAGGRRAGAVARGGGSAGRAGHHRSAAGFDRQARRVDLRIRAGRGADRSGQILAGAAFGAEVRDEAHRFAVTFHRTRRNASRLRSELDQIPGVGEKTVTKLLRHFGSLERVRQAPEEELARVAGRAARDK